jgi:hypothetical protein
MAPASPGLGGLMVPGEGFYVIPGNPRLGWYRLPKSNMPWELPPSAALRLFSPRPDGDLFTAVPGITTPDAAEAESSNHCVNIGNQDSPGTGSVTRLPNVPEGEQWEALVVGKCELKEHQRRHENSSAVSWPRCQCTVVSS